MESLEATGKSRKKPGVKPLLIEPRGTVNTGDGAMDERTVENDRWIRRCSR
ncbi:hypothetical protein [Robbsia betulipollinis]|uniref:hypothetical protein n=1 Tax=Robbsia betulipollinis TaxID=2981849 RepID=UPI002271856E|nr:hypothetical protein [Robbsia betulipollinis]